VIDIKTVDKHNMIFEETNIYLFHSINSLATQFPIIDKIAVFLADDLNTVFISLLVLMLVLKWKTHHLIFAKTLFIVLISLILSDLIEYLGHKLIGHGLSSSFPSQHTLTVVIIAFAYLLAGFKTIGIIGLFVSLVVGLSRIYVGVHFPFDVVGSFLIGFLLVVFSNYMLKEMSLRIRRMRLQQLFD